jgi:hypothetical protein
MPVDDVLMKSRAVYYCGLTAPRADHTQGGRDGQDAGDGVRKIAEYLHRANPYAACDPRCAQPVVFFSSTEKNSYIAMAMTPITTSPANASGMRMAEPAETSR